jgi:SAM-dependent methyltransferase
MENKIGNFFTKINKYIQFRIDTTKYFFDKPNFDYQPLPWIDIKKTTIRGKATYERWEAIKKYLVNYKSLKDVGCCVGFFCHKAAETYNMNIIGIDYNERFLRIAQYAKQYVKNGNNELFCNMKVDKNNADVLPKTDVTILFSLWHHWVFHYGLNNATQILKIVWLTTNHVLLFESGEEETKKEFNLPFDKKASDWLEEYLSSNLDRAKIEKVGEFSAGDYPHYKIKEHKRTVFVAIKK